MRSRNAVFVVLLLAILFLAAAENLSSGTDEYQVTINIPDVSAYPGEEIEIPFYITNLIDTVKAFEMMVTLDRPDIFLFNVDPGPAVSLQGTLTEGWWSIGTNDYGTGGTILSIFGSSTPYPGLFPQDGSTPFFKLVGHVLDVPDTLQDRTVNLIINTDMLDNFSFSDPWGVSIGVIVDTVIESECFACAAWVQDICFEWIRVDCDNPELPIDSTWCCDTTYFASPDTSYINVDHGSVTALRDICGDYNGDQAGNILDILYAIGCLYGVNPDCDAGVILDVNCDGVANIIDITYYIAYLYQNGPALCCSQ